MRIAYYLLSQSTIAVTVLVVRCYHAMPLSDTHTYDSRKRNAHFLAKTALLWLQESENATLLRQMCDQIWVNHRILVQLSIGKLVHVQDELDQLPQVGYTSKTRQEEKQLKMPTFESHGSVLLSTANERHHMLCSTCPLLRLSYQILQHTCMQNFEKTQMYGFAFIVDWASCNSQWPPGILHWEASARERAERLWEKAKKQKREDEDEENEEEEEVCVQRR